MNTFPLCAAAVAVAASICHSAHADDGYQLKRCEVLPLPDHQVSFRIDGVEKFRWHFDRKYPRPFFYPFNGPSGTTLTRMGHPGAENHDHHRSVWFAYHKVEEHNFWADGTGTQIRQKHWYAFSESDEEGVMAVHLGWYTADGVEILEQDVVAAVRPLQDDEYELEIQTTLRPAKDRDQVTLQQTNFGLLAVRVAASVSAAFGGGNLTNSEGAVGEKQIFGKQASWMDYSGPVAAGRGQNRHLVTEGITFFDHPDNPRYPSYWHVRQDGWMGASYGMQEDRVLTEDDPLTLRYLLHSHSGPADAERAAAVQKRFAARPPFLIRGRKPGESHRQYVVERQTKTSAE
jgi:hypothetical protein